MFCPPSLSLLPHMQIRNVLQTSDDHDTVEGMWRENLENFYWMGRTKNVQDFKGFKDVNRQEVRICFLFLFLSFNYLNFIGILAKKMKLYLIITLSLCLPPTLSPPLNR